MSQQTPIIYAEIGKILKSLDKIMRKMTMVDSEQKEYLTMIEELAKKVEVVSISASVPND